MKELLFAVKYPFSVESKIILENSKSSATTEILEKAVQRIKNSLKGLAQKSSAVHPSEMIEEIASYATARMILASMRNSYIINKFAISEAKRAYSYLNNDSEENIQKLLEEFKFVLNKSNGNFLLHFSTYLKYSPGSIDYRLINRNLNKGYVQINNHERLRLLQEAIKEKVQRLPFLKSPAQEIRTAAQSIISELPAITPDKLSFKKGDNPPCIEALLLSVKKHQNLSHQARWFLAVYLLNRKMDSENIVELFSNLPDFKEKISTYQIEHAKRQRYLAPSCSTLRGYGLCVANCNIKNPLSWKGKNKDGEKK